MDKSLSNFEIQNILKNSCLIVSYKKLKQIPTIDKLLKGKLKYLIILYEWKQGYGHWTCILKQGKTLEFFDSYGTRPDMELKDISNYARNRFGMDFPLVAQMLLNSKKEIHYNNYQLQSQRKGVATCGRWVAYRCLNSNLNIDQFVQKIKKSPIKNKDEFIVQATSRYF